MPDEDGKIAEEALESSNDGESVEVGPGIIFEPEDGEAKKVSDSKKIKESMSSSDASGRKSMRLYPGEFTVENQEIEQEGNSFFRSNWQSLFEEEEREFVFQMHWTGLSEEQAELSHEELLQEDNVSVHADLRLERDSSTAFGFSPFENGSIEKDSLTLQAARDKNPNEDRLEGQWKSEASFAWMGLDETVFEPGEKGAPGEGFAKVISLDSGTWSPGVVHKNSVELFFDGDELDSRAIVSFVPLPSNETWMLFFPGNQTPEAESTTLDTKVRQLKASSTEHEVLVWNNPEDRESPSKVNLSRFELSEDNLEEITVEEMNALWS